MLLKWIANLKYLFFEASADKTSNGIHLDIDRVSHLGVLKGSLGNGVWDQVNTDGATVCTVHDLVDGQAHAINGDRALESQIFGTMLGCLDLQSIRINHGPKCSDLTHYIHIAQDHMYV